MNQAITLKKIAEFYKKHYVEKIIEFHVRDKKTPLQIRFDEGHLAHLLGLHKFKFKRGEELYEQILNGLITFNTLKKRDEGAFKENQLRLKYFPYINDILKEPYIAYFDKKIVRSVINANFIFYMYNEKYNRYLSLGIRKEYSSDYYIPVTFLESKKNRWANCRHILLQDYNFRNIIT